MSTFNYTGLLTKVRVLLDKFGADITLVRLDQTAGDITKPWLGPADVSAGHTTVKTSAVIVPPNTVRQFGLTALGIGTEWMDVLQKSEMIVIGTYDSAFNIEDYQEILDQGGLRWGIIGAQVLKPAETALLFFLGVRR
jgi:hypothetical protein